MHLKYFVTLKHRRAMRQKTVLIYKTRTFFTELLFKIQLNCLPNEVKNQFVKYWHVFRDLLHLNFVSGVNVINRKCHWPINLKQHDIVVNIFKPHTITPVTHFKSIRSPPRSHSRLKQFLDQYLFIHACKINTTFIDHFNKHAFG